MNQRPDAPGQRTLTLEGYDPATHRTRELTFTGHLLGEASSRAKNHSVPLVHEAGSFAPPGTRCSACRWFEVRIWSIVPLEVTSASSSPLSGASGTVLGADGWVIETVGCSTVPDEVDRRQFRHTTEPRGVIAALVQSRAPLDAAGRRIEDADEDVFIPATSRRALDDAADQDERLAEIVDQLLVFD